MEEQNDDFLSVNDWLELMRLIQTPIFYAGDAMPFAHTYISCILDMHNIDPS